MDGARLYDYGHYRSLKCTVKTVSTVSITGERLPQSAVRRHYGIRDGAFGPGLWHHKKPMKPKACDEGPTALRNFTRTMQALFRVPKAEVAEPKHKPVGKSTKKPR
jgi:hypothetical protein